LTCKTVCCAGRTPALNHARHFLATAGVLVAETPGWDTHHLLLDVPSFRPGLWTEEQLSTLLSSLPREVTIWGGNLHHPALEGFRTVDLLQDEGYLQENAVITARCTVPIAEGLLKTPWENLPVLIIGWGRIGKALAAMLKRKGCTVTIGSETESHRLSAAEQGFFPADFREMRKILPSFRLIVNTAPAPVLSEDEGALCRNCVKIDLASVKGMEGQDVVWARALPGRYAPEASGQLIAETFLRRRKEAEK